MPDATMTSKGQLTVPVEVRRRLGLKAGTRVSFVPTEDGSYELRVKTGSAQDLKGILHGRVPTVSLEQMDEAIARGAADTMRR
jgi:AbrB family looped-hinge helix DNA binding protein